MINNDTFNALADMSFHPKHFGSNLAVIESVMSDMISL